jgi:hypothetical protein
VEFPHEDENIENFTATNVQSAQCVHTFSRSEGLRAMRKHKARKTCSQPSAGNPLPSRAIVKLDTGQMQPSTIAPNRAQILERAHPLMVGGMPYGLLTERLAAENGELCDLAAPAALTFIEDMRPKDGLERLALSQALSAHARACWLTELMTRQTDAVGLSAISEASERAANTLARLMRAFREYREPRNATVSIAQVGQANLGNGQLVQNLLKQEVSQKIKRDEQTRILSTGDAAHPKTLLTLAERLAVTAAQHPADSAMDKKHRSQNPGGKSPSRSQCAKARCKVRRDHRAAKTNNGND